MMVNTNPLQNLSLSLILTTAQLSSAIEEYRAKVTARNRAALTHELQELDAGSPIEISSTDPEDVALIVAELWQGPEARTPEFKARVKKVGDFFALGILPDGTLPPYPAELQERVLENLETALNAGEGIENVPLEARPLRVPDDYKRLLAMVGGVIGPGLPVQRATSVTAAVHGLAGSVLSKEEIEPLVKIQLGEDQWKIAAGWQCGGSMHGGASYVVLCKCTGDPSGRYREWAWRYLFVPGMDGGHVFEDLVEFLEGYLEWYENSE